MEADGVSVIDVVTFFSCLWPSYVKADLQIELWPRDRQCPFAACVMSDGDGWWMVADSTVPLFDLFQNLLHETRHVMLGDVDHSGSRARKAAVRAVISGQATDTQAAFVADDSSTSVATVAAREHERRVDRWAHSQALRWWPWLVETGDAVKAFEIVQWIERQEG